MKGGGRMKIFKNRGDIYISKSKGIKSAEERVLLIILAIIVILTIAFVVMLSQKYSSVAEFFVGEDVSVSDMAVDDMESLPQISGKSNYLLICLLIFKINPKFRVSFMLVFIIYISLWKMQPKSILINL